MIESVIGFLKMNDVEYVEDEPLKHLSTIGIGGKAKIIAYPNNLTCFIKTIDFIVDNKIKYKILGRMSNVLPRDEDYVGIIIKTDRLSKFSVSDRSLIAHTGATIPNLSLITSRCGLSGMEELSGIPGSLGGAITGNAGAFNREISDLIVSVDCYDISSKSIMRFQNAQCNFSYRSSLFKDNNFVVLSAVLDLSDSSVNSAMAKMFEYRQKRLKNQPVGVKSIGSTFKRTKDGTSAAYYIDKCGLKGLSFGDAQISEKHAGFIINNGHALSTDYLGLVAIIKQKVKENFNVALTEEIEILN